MATKNILYLKRYSRIGKNAVEVDKEYISIGDAGENNLLVGRFMTDVKKPEVVNNGYSARGYKNFI